MFSEQLRALPWTARVAGVAWLSAAVIVLVLDLAIGVTLQCVGAHRCQNNVAPWEVAPTVGRCQAAFCENNQDEYAYANSRFL